MKYIIIIFTFLILLIIALPFSLEGQCSSKGKIQKAGLSENCSKSVFDYEVWKTGKSEDDDGVIYLSFVSINEKFLNRECVCQIAKSLNKNFEIKKRVKVFLFDDAKIAKSFSEGKFHPQDLTSLIRGMYFLDKGKSIEYIKLSSEQGKPWDEITIQINDLCNYER